MVTAWYMTMLAALEIPWSRIWHLSFAEKKNKGISILTETHIKHDLNSYHHQIHIRNNWFSPIFFSHGESHQKGLLFLLQLGLEGIPEVDTNSKGVFCPLRYSSPSNDRVLCIYAPSGYSTRRQLARGCFFKGL